MYWAMYPIVHRYVGISLGLAYARIAAGRGLYTETAARVQWPTASCLSNLEPRNIFDIFSAPRTGVTGSMRLLMNKMGLRVSVADGPLKICDSGARILRLRHATEVNPAHASPR